MEAGVEREVRDLEAEVSRLLDAARSQFDQNRRVAVHKRELVQGRLGVAGDDEEAHGLESDHEMLFAHLAASEPLQ